ncbi:ChaN family lipoprotein [Phaeobacter sp. B1627]|uniref:ChaN family lipoprotein n=1 Tax=Phaeobacter sp. B1627 TaxID=2583809 RepID=UPI00111886B0|nr:ChaN family lipoprotein [Phaeobacter sp. B1627]TNJ44820.1 hypothetical protein FGE21_07260 [Phaeobacter sp. B1627]
MRIPFRRHAVSFIARAAVSSVGSAIFGLGGAYAQSETVEQAAEILSAADIVILGETHDNPEHHRIQARLISELDPTAVVWEMLTPSQAALLTPAELESPETLGDLLDWSASGWPEFALYQPVFEAARAARHLGAMVPRDKARASMQSGIVASFGTRDAEVFGLDQPLAEAEQMRREADQLSAHCDALPQDLLPAMVDIQRLRDASLARAALQAWNEVGGPVVIVTGNGHARLDRGVPVYLAQAAPHVSVRVLGQAEGSRIDGTFDVVLSADPVDRPDPCAAFR